MQIRNGVYTFPVSQQIWTPLRIWTPWSKSASGYGPPLADLDPPENKGKREPTTLVCIDKC